MNRKKSLGVEILAFDKALKKIYSDPWWNPVSYILCRVEKKRLMYLTAFYTHFSIRHYALGC